MSDSETLLKADNVGKIFCRDLKTSLWYGLKDSLRDLAPGWERERDVQGDPALRRGEFWANRGISFELRRGECLGLIGHNGAGKTTLLKMLNGLLRPDTGRIEVRGRVGSLIALGAGFNPILTGRENIFVNAAVLGLTRRETLERFDEIVEFSELEEFIDTPVRNYSSGMQVRLGFAVASALSPQILLLDEVLAVGDMNFRAKCFNRLSQLRQAGVSFIFVTHQIMDLSRYATRCLYLEEGRIRSDVDVDTAIGLYLAANPASDGLAAGVSSEPGTGRIQIRDVLVQMHRDFHIDLSLHSHLDADRDIEFGMTVSADGGELMQFTIDEDQQGDPLRVCARSDALLRVRLPAVFPQKAPWFLSVTVWGKGGTELFHRKDKLRILQQPRRRHFGQLSAAVKVEQLSDPPSEDQVPANSA